MEGNLYKYKNILSGWKKRYFILKDNILYYYKHKGDKVKGRIHLSVATIKEDTDKDKKKFEIHSGITVFHLKAENTKERDSWLSKLRSVKFETENQDNDILSKNLMVYEDKNQAIIDEIASLQSKLSELKLYTSTLQNYNEKISELAKDKNYEEIKVIVNANRVIKSIILGRT